jgi:hypothetical protein
VLKNSVQRGLNFIEECCSQAIFHVARNKRSPASAP